MWTSFVCNQHPSSWGEYCSPLGFWLSVKNGTGISIRFRWGFWSIFQDEYKSSDLVLYLLFRGVITDISDFCHFVVVDVEVVKLIYFLFIKSMV